MALCFAAAGYAKDIKTVVLTTSPQMHCENCENKIKSNIRFEKGIKEITTDLETKTVTIKYDADKTNVENIIKGFAKIDYKASVADGKAAKAEAADAASCCGSSSCKCGSGTPCGSSCGDAPAAGTTVAYFKAEQMKCGGCAAKVKKNMLAEAGVKDVAVDLGTKVVSITYDPKATDAQKLVEGFKKFDYTVVECDKK